MQLCWKLRCIENQIGFGFRLWLGMESESWGAWRFPALVLKRTPAVKPFWHFISFMHCLVHVDWMTEWLKMTTHTAKNSITHTWRILCTGQGVFSVHACWMTSYAKRQVRNIFPVSEFNSVLTLRWPLSLVTNQNDPLCLATSLENPRWIHSS